MNPGHGLPEWDRSRDAAPQQGLPLPWLSAEVYVGEEQMRAL